MANGWGRRRRTVYAYDVRDLRFRSRPVRLGYVGKTSSHISYRDAQNRAGQPWGRQIVGPVRILWTGECGRVSLWLREVWYITRLRPLFNVEWNRANPDRVPPWAARRLYEAKPMSYPFAR